MTELRGQQHGGAVAARRALSVSVLADRMAAALLHHEPGWRLPRLTALARRYNVSAAEVDAAIDQLTARHLLTRLPDGQVFRASPAEYRLALEGLPGLASHVDPMGGVLSCKSRNVSKRRAPEDIARALGLLPGGDVLTIRSTWSVGGEPAAFSTTYLPERLEELVPEFASAGLPADASPRAGYARAIQVEIQPPPPSVARSLRLAAGEPTATVTVRFEDAVASTPVALTIAVLRPDLFRIVVESPASPLPAGPLPGQGADDSQGAWTRASEDWEP